MKKPSHGKVKQLAQVWTAKYLAGYHGIENPSCLVGKCSTSLLYTLGTEALPAWPRRSSWNLKSGLDSRPMLTTTSQASVAALCYGRSAGLAVKDLAPILSSCGCLPKSRKSSKPQFLHLKMGLNFVANCKVCAHCGDVTGQGENLGRVYLVRWRVGRSRQV